MQLRCKRKIYKEKYRMFARDSPMLRNKRHFIISLVAINVFYCIPFSTCRFLRTGSTAKKTKSKPYMGFDTDSSQENYDELLGLCSGRFQGL